LLLKCIKREHQANGELFMRARSIVTPSSSEIISNLNSSVESIVKELQLIELFTTKTFDANSFERLEIALHEKMSKLADMMAAVTLQQAINDTGLDEAEKELIKSSPKKMKNMGRRRITIRMLGGTLATIEANYYHQKSDTKNRGRKGFYPRLLLLGIHDRCTQALGSRISLFATAACSFEEAKRLMQTLYGFRLDIKTIRIVCKRFAMRARASFKAGEVPLEEEFKGRRVVISADGGRIRTRANKRGRKTKKNRSRYKTDWREPKLILIYVVNSDGEKDRKIPPIMDASLDGPDTTFAMLIYYLKKLGVAAADQLLFVSDGAVWIWDRINDLITTLGIDLKQCVLALDFYHAVEHLTDFATQMKWNSTDSKKWVGKQRRRLTNGKLDIFIQEINRHCEGSKNNLLLREQEYFNKHLPHMRYKEIKDKNLPIGSGGVESGIRRVINLRIKGPGIFWHEDMADAMLLLRSFYKAGRWDLLKNMAILGGLRINEYYL
jgi:hypothetical protein